MRFAQRAEIAFEAWARLMIRWRMAVIGLSLLGTLALAAQLPKLTVYNNLEAFLKPDDPTLVEYHHFTERFGKDEIVLIALQPRRVFDLEFLSTLREIHRDLEREVPHVAGITSLINARDTRGEGQELVVEKLLARWPSSAEEVAEIERRALANPLYRNLLISEDLRFTAITIVPEAYSSRTAEVDPLLGFAVTSADNAAQPEAASLSSKEIAELLGAVRSVMARYESHELPVHVAGSLALGAHIDQHVQKDMRVFVLLSLFAVGAFLFLLFGTWVGVALPLAIVVFSVLGTLGLMALLGAPLSLITSILPSFILVVGVFDAVHMLTIVFQRLADGASRTQAIVDAFGHSGLAIFFTSLTTAAGMFSFVAAEVQPIIQLGIFGPAGVTLAWILTMTLLPAVLAVLPLERQRGALAREGPRLLVRALVATGEFSARHAHAVVACSAALIVLSLVGASGLRVSFDPMGWFPEGDSLRASTAVIDRELRGSLALEGVIETGRENALHDPELLRRIERLEAYASEVEHQGLFLGSSVSIADVVKEIHQGLNENRAEFYVIPDERELVAQELLLFENTGSDDLEDLTDAGFSTARVTFKVPRFDSALYAEFLDVVREPFQEILGESGELHLTGAMVLAARTVKAVSASLLSSYLIGFAFIAPQMMLLLGSVRRGLLSMIPNVTPVILTLGLMRLVNIPLDTTTLLIGSVVLGLAVDDTIHFWHKFGQYHAESGDVTLAIRRTLETTGSALLFTAIVLAAGFFIYRLGYMLNLGHFGLLAGFATLVAFLADVTLGPALLAIALRPRAQRASVVLDLPAESPIIPRSQAR